MADFLVIIGVGPGSLAKILGSHSTVAEKLINREMIKNGILLVLIYSLGAFLSYAILRYLSFFTWGLNQGAADEFVTIRVFFGAPLLIILGIVLFLGFKHNIHKVLGILFALGGIAWAIVVIMAIAEESG